VIDVTHDGDNGSADGQICIIQLLLFFVVGLNVVKRFLRIDDIYLDAEFIG